jgi:formylmethanofuran--tetrahydromethanopterin N-formyltransferase
MLTSIIETMVEDTYSEIFSGICSRVIITADDDETIRKAAFDATSTPGAVIGRLEGGVEAFLNEDETPDGRSGAILQFWFGKDDLVKFELELSYRIRQDILVKPFTRVFDASINPIGTIDTMKHVGHCGDGYEWMENLYGRDMIVIPIALPDFMIERKLGYSIGFMGANFWYMCRTKEAVINAGKKALKAIGDVRGVITPFDICSAMSKPETNYPWIGPTTNHPYCPSLKTVLGKQSLIPEGVHYIPEIVINGLNQDVVEESLRVGIQAVLRVEDVLRVSAGNYEGALGDYKIYLRELFE